MTKEFRSDDFRGAQFVDVDMTGARFREVVLTGARIHGALLIDADIDAEIRGLKVNGVEVAPLVEAELDRRHPERVTLRATTADGVRQAWAAVEDFWAATMLRADGLGEADRHRSVDDEWSFTQTLRHLIFVTDAWFGHAVLGEARPFHPIGLPATFMDHGTALGIDPEARPTYAEVVAVRAERVARVREFVATVTQQELDRVREPNPAPGYPPPQPRTALACLRVVFNEEWTHHRFAVRDLTTIESPPPGP